MKKLLLLVLTGISSFNLWAQPTITAASEAKIGDVISITNVDPTGLSQGPAGANQTWNFTSLSSPTTGTSTYVTPSSTPYASDFPSANLAISDGNGNYGYENITNSGEDLLGVENSVEHASYSDGEKVIKYPFTYNDHYTDNFNGTGSSSLDFSRSGTISVKADAYGTITTPAGTFSNVLRVNMKETFIDTFPDLELTYTYAYQSYIWYVDGFNTALFTLTFDTAIAAGFPIITQVADYATTGPATAVRNITPSFLLNVFPTLTHNNIFISTNEPINAIAITNMLGQKVMESPEHNIKAGATTEISVADLPNGIYMCEVTTPSGVLTRKIVKQ